MNKKVNKFERPMFRSVGFMYPIPNNINVRWIGKARSQKGNMYTADSSLERDALNSLMAGACVHEGLNDNNWDKIAQYACSILPDGFGFTVVNYSAMLEANG